MTQSDDFNNYLKTLTPKVLRNVEVVSSIEKPQPFMLHITTDLRSSAYIPRIGHRQADSEDRTVPRITCSDTLLGCIIGHAMAVNNFLDPWVDSEEREKGFRINRLDYDYCLKPNHNLVYDSVATNEHWLVRYNEATSEYKPSKAGHFYIRSITSNFIKDKKSFYQYVVIFLEVIEKTGLYITPEKKVEPGYYKVQFHYSNKVTFKSKNVDIKEIDRQTYLKQETSIPVLEKAMPTYSRW